MAKEIQHELAFLPDESVIKRAERVGYGKPVSTSNNDLYLTNMALIHVKKSIFGKINLYYSPNESVAA